MVVSIHHPLHHSLMFKKTLLATIVIASLFLTGCGETIEPTTGTLYETDTFTIHAPRNWEIVTDFQSNQPKETVVAFRNNVKTKDFIANITITKNTLTSVVSSTDYEKIVTEELQGELVNFKETKSEKMKIMIGSQEADTIFVTFTGKQKVESDTLQFMQIYAVKENVGYIVTASAGMNEEESVVDALTQALKSFSVK